MLASALAREFHRRAFHVVIGSAVAPPGQLQYEFTVPGAVVQAGPLCEAQHLEGGTYASVIKVVARDSEQVKLRVLAIPFRQPLTVIFRNARLLPGFRQFLVADR